MGLAISSTEQVAAELLDAVAKKKTAYLMGGAPTRLFAKLNALSPKLADRLLLKKYGAILKKHFGPEDNNGSNDTKPKKGVLRNIAIGLVVFSFVLYALLPAVPFLPVGLAVKGAITGGMMALSEVVFWVGGIILGKEVVTKMRGVLNPCSWCRCKASGRHLPGA